MGYSFRDVTFPESFSTELTGINNLGELAGSYKTQLYASFDAFTESGSATGLIDVNIPHDQAGGLNNAGQVAVTEGDALTGIEGMVWSPPGSFTTIISQQHVAFIDAFDVNDSGTVAGSFFPLDESTPTGFVYQNGALTHLSVPGASNTQAHGINNAGVIVGTANNYGFIDFGGPTALMGIAGATVVDPMAINNNDIVVGSYNDGTNWHGFIDNGGRLTFIDAPGATDTWVTGINDGGTIVGYLDTGDVTQTTGFAASPMDPIETLVGEYYRAALARDADSGGRNFWANLLRTDLTPTEFVQDLVGSAEFQSLHGQQSDADYVDNLYLNALGRHAEADGQGAWVNVLQSGAGRGDVLEGQQHFATWVSRDGADRQAPPYDAELPPTKADQRAGRA